MSSIFNKLYELILIKRNSITIKQANIFTTIFIFLFTVIFANLLITENYHDYERALYTDKFFENSSNTTVDITDEREKKLKALLIKNTIAIATLAFILFAIVLGLYKVLNSIIENDIQEFLDFFHDNVKNQKNLNTEDIFFQDFKVMVSYANNMVSTINEQKESLKELNASLEDKVKIKTYDLLESNKNLLKEKQFSEDILASQKEFIRYTVHETNTPLSVILTSLELYQMKHEKDKHLSKVEAAAKNIFNIYDDLSYLVKKEHVEYPRIAIDIESFIKSRIDFFSEVALLSKVKFNFMSEISKVYIYFNETKLQRIIDNTITNAIKYTYQNEIVDITLKHSNLYVKFSMGSYSQHIQDVDRIFDEYYRENTYVDKVTQGFGIGLRLVKNICDEEGVDISITSDDKRNIFTYLFKVMGE